MNTKIRIVNSQEYPLPNPPAWIENWFIRHRFWLFVILCLLVAAVEYSVEPLVVNFQTSSEYWELIIFFLVIVGVASLVEILLRTLVAKSFAVDLLEIKHDLNVRLEMASDWNNLVDLILAFCEAVVDPDRVVLLFNTESDRFELAGQSQSKDYMAAHNGSGASTDEACIVSEGAAKVQNTVRNAANTAGELLLLGYCLPLKISERIIAKLIFYLPSGRSPSDRQTSIFQNCTPDLAIALTTAQMRKEQANLLIDQVRNVQRHAISRNLHDALGQKLIYLRFKLDQLVNSNEKNQLSCINDDLKQMLSVANESCELVRGTIAVLDNNGSPSLMKLLIDQSRLAVNRNLWEITFNETGSPQMLLPETVQQILYIFGEALSNVERHAVAQQVKVELIWRETELVIKIVDNGRGFNLAEVQKEGHYGLTFMRERVETLGGCLDMHSTPDKGTSLTIVLPLEDNEDVNSPVGIHDSKDALNADEMLFP